MGESQKQRFQLSFIRILRVAFQRSMVTSNGGLILVRELDERLGFDELVSRGRLMLAVEIYRKGEASLGRVAELAGVPVGQMIDILGEYGVKANLEKEDYLKGLESLRRAW